MLYIPATVPTVDDIRASSKLGWEDVYCARSDGGGGGDGYNTLILHPYEHFNERKIIFLNFIQNYTFKIANPLINKYLWDEVGKNVIIG